MMDAGRHPRIEILRCSELLTLEGEAGAFRATIRRHPTGVDEARCTACGACAEVCPAEGLSRFDAGMGPRKAIGRPFPQSVPAAYAIDFELCRQCKLCVKACTRDAIDLDATPEDRILEVGAVIAATGFDEFDPRVLRNYGYGVYPNVLTSLELERLLNASGPTLGHVRRPSDGGSPRNLIYVQCVGSRGEAGRAYCSRFCCMNAIKDGLLLKQHEPDLEAVTILYTDVRAFGKGFEEFYGRARDTEWIHFLRGRPAKILEDPASHDLQVAVENTETGEQLRLTADMVILSCGGVPTDGTAELAARLGITTTPHGFFQTSPGERPMASNRAGVFVCGSATGPQVIPDCVTQGSAAATEAAISLGGGVPPVPAAAGTACPSEAAGESAVEEHAANEWDDHGIAGGDTVEDGAPRIGVFLCHCGVNIAGVLDMSALLATARDLPSVVHVGEELFACSSSSQQAIQDAIEEHKLTRVVVAACTPRTHEPIFRQNCLEAGLNPYLLEMVNVRDQCSWVHAAAPGQATAKALDLLRMGVARARRLEPLEPIEVSVSRRVVVMGAGLPGMKAASDLKALGFEVTLIESAPAAGGLLRDLHSLYPDGRDAQEAVGSMLARVAESGVDLRLSTDIRQVTGFVGNFRVRLGPAQDSGETISGKPESRDATRESAGEHPAPRTPVEPGPDEEDIEAGAIVVAIGADPYVPAEGEFGYRTYRNVITSVELEARLAQGTEGLAGVERVAFIQCVGSRRDPADSAAARTDGAESAERPAATGCPGCSRICCPTTIKQAQQLHGHDIDSTIFYRDMRMVGCGAEESYRQAREMGTLFIRYDASAPPVVQGRDGRAHEVVAEDTLLRGEVIAEVDLVVLAVGLVPRAQEAGRVQQMLKTPRGTDGFFLERHPELAPVETCVDGVVLCGTAQGAKDLRDSLIQASAAAARVAALLGAGRLFLEPTACRVDPDRCRGCGLCVSICEFQAPGLVTDPAGSLVASINAALCKGCGTCAVWCPTGAITAQHFTDDQITAMIDDLFAVEVHERADH